MRKSTQKLTDLPEVKEKLDHISFLGNRARYRSIELDMSTELDRQSISVNRTRYLDTELDIHSCSVFIHRAPSVIELDFTIELAKHRAR